MNPIQQDEIRYRTLIEQLPMTTYIRALDETGAMLYVSPQITDLLGVSAHEWLANPDLRRSMIHVDDRERVILEEQRQFARDQRFHSEYRMQTPDGRTLWIAEECIVVEDGPTHQLVAHGFLADISQRRQAEAALEMQAFKDSLTDLPNRRLLLDRLRQTILLAQREKSQVALLLMDLNRFKEINDTFGHDDGDQVLRVVGRALQGCLRKSDTVARLGGDEFAILLPGTDRTGAEYSASKLQHALEEPMVLQGQTFDIEASIGITLFPDHGDSAISLLRCAEIAMYFCKEAGGGYSIFASDQDKFTPDRLTLIRELRQGIDANQLVLHYQPKVDIKTRLIEGVEALVRWRHPERGFIQPNEFISLAEHTGLIKPLAIWVLTSAMRQCRLWHDAGMDITVAVNLSARNLTDPNLVETIATLIELYRIQPDWLEVEITESGLMEDPVRAMENLTNLHSMGVRVSIDDFGTGYSSLSYLKRLPVDQIKIDRSFVTDMVTSKDDTFIVRTIVDLSDNLGLKVVAEGIENQETMDELAAIGCDFAQGFFMTRPLPADELSRWIEMSSWGLKQ